jgi:hypothetical protein
VILGIHVSHSHNSVAVPGDILSFAKFTFVLMFGQQAYWKNILTQIHSCNTVSPKIVDISFSVPTVHPFRNSTVQPHPQK